MAFPVRRLFILTVAAFYIYLGVSKVTPVLNEGLHSEFKSTFSGHAKVFPGRFNIKVDAELYRLVFGVVEILCGALLVVGEGIWAYYAVYTLLGLQTFVCLSLYSQGESTKCIPSLVALTLVGVIAGGNTGAGYHYKLE